MPSNRELLDPSRMPRHVGIIMDGNGRWATERRYPRVYGHRNAVKAVRATVEAAVELELEVLTLYAFSTENWKRPAQEVSTLMDLFAEYLQKELKTMLDNNVRFQVAGESQGLPQFLQQPLNHALESTSGKYRTSFEPGGQLRREGRISPCGEEDLFPGPEWKSQTRGNQ